MVKYLKILTSLNSINTHFFQFCIFKAYFAIVKEYKVIVSLMTFQNVKWYTEKFCILYKLCLSCWNYVTINFKNNYLDTRSLGCQCLCKHAEHRYKFLPEIMQTQHKPSLPLLCFYSCVILPCVYLKMTPASSSMPSLGYLNYPREASGLGLLLCFS